MKPITREEMYLAAAAGYAVTPPEPVTRKEMFLAKLAGMEVETPAVFTRQERFLDEATARAPSVTINNQDITVTENGQYTADEGYTGLGTVTVEVPDEPAVLEDLEVTENGNYTPSEGVDGFGSVSVNVPDIPAVIQPLEITENGTYTAPDGVDGYSPVVVNVTTASADLKYVTFKSYDGTVEYGKKAVAVGDDCADPIARGIFAKPTRESDVQYNYTFYGWASVPNGGAVSNWNKAITEDKTVYANFNSTVRYYTITYYDSDGTTVLKTESLAYGAMPSYAPEKTGYKFMGWTPSPTGVTENASYTASWVEALSLADYTWEAIDAMTLAEMQENFKIGDVKDKCKLIGFAKDDLVSGGKARMTFIYWSGNYAVDDSLASTSVKSHINTYYYDILKNAPSSVFPEYSNLQPVLKNVRKKYVSAPSTGEIGTFDAYLFALSASELGFEVDGDTVFDEGEKYDFFPAISISDTVKCTMPGMYNGLQYSQKNLRSWCKTNPLYLASGKLTKYTSYTKLYCTFGFCI